MSYTVAIMKKYFILYTAILFAFPLLVSAQTMQKLLTNIPVFLYNIALPFLFGIAFLVLVVNVIRYFVFAGNNEDGQKKAKALIMYSLAAFAFIIVFAGIVNMLSASLGLDKKSAPCPDYVKEFGDCATYNQNKSNPSTVPSSQYGNQDGSAPSIRPGGAIPGSDPMNDD